MYSNKRKDGTLPKLLYRVLNFHILAHYWRISLHLPPNQFPDTAIHTSEPLVRSPTFNTTGTYHPGVTPFGI